MRIWKGTINSGFEIIEERIIEKIFNINFILFSDIIVVHLKEKFNIEAINEQGRQRIMNQIKTDLLTEAVNRRLSGANAGLIFKKKPFFVFFFLNNL